MRDVVARGRRQGVRYELDPAARLQVLEAGQDAGVRYPRKAGGAPLTWKRHPIRLLVLAEQDAAQVDAPGRFADRRLEPQLAEWNRNFDVPALVVDRRLVVPHRVPVVVDGAAVFDGVGVLVGAERVGAEIERVAMVVEGVDGDLELIALVQSGVALHLAGQDAGRIAVPDPDAEIQRLVVVEHAKLGLLGRGFSVLRFALDEVALRRRQRPGLVGQLAVNLRLLAIGQLDGDGAESLGVDGLDIKRRLSPSRHITGADDADDADHSTQSRSHPTDSTGAVPNAPVIKCLRRVYELAVRHRQHKGTAGLQHR